MIRALLQFLRLLHFPTFVRGLGRAELGRSTPVHNGKFASFMAVQGSYGRRSDRSDRRLRLQKLMRVMVAVLAVGGAGWIAVESVKALSVF